MRRREGILKEGGDGEKEKEEKVEERKGERKRHSYIVGGVPGKRESSLFVWRLLNDPWQKLGWHDRRENIIFFAVSTKYPGVPTQFETCSAL